MLDFKNYPLLKHNTFGIEASASRFIEYESEEELRAAIAAIGCNNVLHIGGGSNLLFTGDFKGTVLHSAIRGIETVEETDKEIILRVGAGEIWDDFVAYTVEQDWSGIENLSLIPGEVGASAVQNIGAYGVEAKDVISVVEAIELSSGEKRVFGNIECGYGYRQSIFKSKLKGKYAITYVTFRLSKIFSPKLDYGNIRSTLGNDTKPTVARVRQAIISMRMSKLPDPKVLGNAGSFFMNPIVSQEKFESLRTEYPDMPYYPADNGVKIPAGWMIEQCGWKGKKLNHAGVHSRQALVLVNLGKATGKDILTLSDTICRNVKEKFGIDIHPEVNII
ncbi:MAG: UDP-N-acetylmuramate dehydrogenase [Bacteroides sp.]|nr:UDP-N-acetylmuramate dehydrogenase [Roseburia sp.]MCM1346794.1 UDP-N-acetylmuramate dehydrogenase [Bacteroides sp.]MCM1420275.1 UDP-N-acetylmuramate dehydrogenase [Bacteroides sp.]